MESFALPTAFVELHREGCFDYWGAPYGSLSNEQRETIMRTRWSRVLVLRSIEWDMSPEEIAAFQGDDMGMRPGLVRFAGDGSGDAFCWYPRWQEGEAEPPVIFWSHDGGETGLFARSFAECVLRCILHDAADGDEDVRPEHWDNHVTMIGPWLESSQRELLTALGKSFSQAARKAAHDALVAEIGERALVGAMPSEQYYDGLGKETLLRLYTESVGFWRDIVEEEGREAYRPRLEQALAQLQRFA